MELDSGRIVASRRAGGRIEFGWQPADGGERVLPQQRYFPTDATVDRWLRSTEIELDEYEARSLGAAAWVLGSARYPRQARV